jgi:hypothetical protein
MLFQDTHNTYKNVKRNNSYFIKLNLFTEGQIKGVGPTVLYKKNNGQLWYKYLGLGRDKSYFVLKKKALILPKSSQKLISSTWSSFWLTTYLLCLVDVFFNRESAYLWVQTVLLYSPTLFVWGRLHAKSSQEKRKEASSIL